MLQIVQELLEGTVCEQAISKQQVHSVPDKVQIFITVQKMPISGPNSMFNHLLE